MSDKPEPYSREYFAAQGAVGGSAKGKRKARTSKQARAAVNARWAKLKPKGTPCK